MNILEKFLPVKMIVLDMDGVLTDGTVLVMPDGQWVRRMHIRDGYALQLAVKKGYRLVVITGSSSGPVADRLRKLGIEQVFQEVKDKRQLLQSLMQQFQLSPEQVLFMGDDMPDLDAMKFCGLSCCPADSARDILEIAGYISPLKGGEGCVRDVLEKLMRLQGTWEQRTDVSST
jgi:3-deoxy-D-manno-octulosonate 8-phosphate phosphatase (KDO 8-P phosphatase)